MLHKVGKYSNNWLCIHLITCGVYLSVGTEEAVEDKRQLILFFLLPFLSFSLSLCWGLLSDCPRCNTSVIQWITGTKGVQTALCSGNIRAPCSRLSHRLWMHQSSNLLCFYCSGSLSAALLPVDIRTTQDLLNIQSIAKKKKKKGLGAYPSLSPCLREEQLDANHSWQICLTCPY